MTTYFLTSIRTVSDSRTFGYYRNIDDAFISVISNIGDMCECYYNYLIIEGIEEGIHPFVQSEFWFHWSNKENKWKQLISKPECFNGITNWALG